MCKFWGLEVRNMTTGQVTQLGKEMMLLSLYLCAPVVVVGMIVGLVISVIQTVTQIQEQSVSFVLKMIASGAALLFFSPWMLRKTLDFAAAYLGNLVRYIN